MKKRRKVLFAGVMACFVLLAVELLLRVALVTRQHSETAAEFSGHSRVFREVQSEAGTRLVTASAKQEWFNHQSFSKEKVTGVRRIFCLGGSTTYGRPYDDRTSFAGWLRAFLNGVAGDEPGWEIINVGGISYGSQRVSRVLDEVLSYEPDAVVLYTGHNEFLERTTHSRLAAAPGPIVNIGAMLREHSAIARTLAGWTDQSQNAVSGADRSKAEVSALLDSSVGLDAYHRDADWRDQVVISFRSNVAGMIDASRQAGVPIFFVLPACQLRECRPFKSEFSTGTAQRERVITMLNRLEVTMQAEDRAHAVDDAAAIVNLDPEFALGHYLHGEALYHEGRFEEALQAFKRARDTDICPLRAISEISAALRAVVAAEQIPLVDFEERIAELSAHGIPGADLFLDHVHPTIEGHRQLALSLLKELHRAGLVDTDPSRDAEAVEAITKSVFDGVDAAAHATAIRNLSKVLSWAGKFEEADRLAIRALEMLPHDAETLYQAGSAWFRFGNLDKALEAYEHASRVAPQSAESHFGIGLVWAERGDWIEAIPHYEKAAALKPNFPDILFNLARAYENTSRLDDAQRGYRAIIRHAPDFGPAYNGLGTSLARQGRLKEAIACFRTALKVNPNDPMAKQNLDTALKELGRRNP